jgi:hypothetical protein
MNKRQQRALKQLHQDTQLETEPEHKDPYLTTSEDEQITHTKKRPRGKDTITEEHTGPNCIYCYQKYAPEILQKHQQKCPKRDHPGKLHQTTITFK